MWLARCPPEAKRSAPDTGTVSAVETVAESGTAVKRVTTMLRTRDTTTGTDHDVASGSWEGAHHHGAARGWDDVKVCKKTRKNKKDLNGQFLPSFAMFYKF